MLGARQIAIDSTEAHFDSESDPQGNPWEALDISYKVGKKKVNSEHPDDILQLTGAGKAAATSESAYFIRENEIWFEPGTMPSYMAYHQRGTKHTGATAALQTGGERGLTAAEQKTLSQHYGRGKALPKREFIGLDIDAIAELEIFANDWFAQNVIDYFPPEFPTGSAGGAIGSRTGFNMLGEFPIIGFTKRGQPMLRTPQGVRFGRL